MDWSPHSITEDQILQYQRRKQHVEAHGIDGRSYPLERVEQLLVEIAARTTTLDARLQVLIDILAKTANSPRG